MTRTVRILPDLSLHALAVPAYRRGLGSLEVLLREAVAAVAAGGFDPAVVLHEPLAAQFPSFGAHARGACRHVEEDLRSVLSGGGRLLATAPASFDELLDDVAGSTAFLATVDADELEAASGRMVDAEGEAMVARDFILGHSLPHFYFHVGAATLILRHHGVAVGDPALFRDGGVSASTAAGATLPARN